MLLFLEKVDKHAQTHPSIFKDGQLAAPAYVSLPHHSLQVVSLCFRDQN